MIALIRVDDRLLHGQVAFLWTKSLAVQKIIIANDNAANDEFLKMTLGLAKPMGVELEIVDVKQGTEIVRSEIATSKIVMVVINNLKDAKTILDSVKEIKSLNLGGLRERPGSTRYSHSVTLTQEDVQICKDLIKNGIEVEIRMVPEDHKVFVEKLL